MKSIPVIVGVGMSAFGRFPDLTSSSMVARTEPPETLLARKVYETSGFPEESRDATLTAGPRVFADSLCHHAITAGRFPGRLVWRRLRYGGRA